MKTIKEQLSELKKEVYPTGSTRYSHYDEEHDVVLDFFQEENNNLINVSIHSDNFFTTKTVVDLDDEINLNDIVNIVNDGNIY
ncbi:hypothetical protein SAMN05421839_11650 [Halolactibacillus halophilus]|uniref:Uncharacterized protein n=1 Tax=Halolactibacillus halophilus TaxID=306540 RepID=A0A1I5PUA9_9BACI|nr:hypothetical protein [Halolactibacillus halophilus]GEM01610.1 hypothetical protein HHA03_11420 [Halolactibacillus halophilus]SFP37181.1 hypothetical protein SAMN05421839_11650 [Halolactibacillus halophilus]